MSSVLLPALFGLPAMLSKASKLTMAFAALTLGKLSGDK